MSTKTEPDAVRTKKMEVEVPEGPKTCIEISLKKILRQRMESTLDNIEQLAQSGKTIAEGAYELGFQIQNRIGDVPPGTSALPGLATALHDLFGRIAKNLDNLKEQIEALLKIDKEARL